MTMREKAVAAATRCDFLIAPTSPVTACGAEAATRGNDPERPFGYIALTVPLNISEQPAAPIRTGYGMPIGSVCRSWATASTPPASCAWPRSNAGGGAGDPGWRRPSVPARTH